MGRWERQPENRNYLEVRRDMSVFVIAEAWVNHNGDFKTALDLVSAAKTAGADAVKFQMFSSQRLWGDDRIKHLELSKDQFTDIAAFCRYINIEFMCTPFGVEELEFLTPLLKRVKIASGCITRAPLLEAVSATGLPVIMSTGMSTMYEIVMAVHEYLQREVTLLHCTSSYPCRLEDVNLKVMKELGDRSSCPVGLSDHTSGITVPIAAVALGAVMIEKHLTLDRNQEGPDHKSSITPKEFKGMRMAIIEVEAALGDGIKRVLPCEEKLRKVWREPA